MTEQNSKKELEEIIEALREVEAAEQRKVIIKELSKIIKGDLHRYAMLFDWSKREYYLLMGEENMLENIGISILGYSALLWTILGFLRILGKLTINEVEQVLLSIVLSIIISFGIGILMVWEEKKILVRDLASKIAKEVWQKIQNDNKND